MSSAAELERLTHDYGREVFARLGRGGTLPFSPGWFDERLMEWTMDNEALKVQLFRFVDVLPTLHSSGEVSRHLRRNLPTCATTPLAIPVPYPLRRGATHAFWPELPCGVARRTSVTVPRTGVALLSNLIWKR